MALLFSTSNSYLHFGAACAAICGVLQCLGLRSLPWHGYGFILSMMRKFPSCTANSNAWYNQLSISCAAPSMVIVVVVSISLSPTYSMYLYSRTVGVSNWNLRSHPAHMDFLAVTLRLSDSLMILDNFTFFFFPCLWFWFCFRPLASSYS